MKTAYKITQVTGRNGEDKFDAEHHTKLFFIKIAYIGVPAQLVYLDNPEYAIRTSAVEQIDIWENTIHITTRNTTYFLQAVIMEDEING